MGYSVAASGRPGRPDHANGTNPYYEEAKK